MREIAHNCTMDDDLPPLVDSRDPTTFDPELIERSIQRVIENGLPIAFNFEHTGTKSSTEAKIRRWATTTTHPDIRATWKYSRVYEEEHVYDSEMDVFRTDAATFCINLRLRRAEQS